MSLFLSLPCAAYLSEADVSESFPVALLALVMILRAPEYWANDWYDTDNKWEARNGGRRFARRSLEPWLGLRREALSGNFRRYLVVKEPGCPLKWAWPRTYTG